MARTFVSTLGMTREEWLEKRRHSIGGSDAAAIVGLSPWASPYSVWADKTGKVPDKPDNEAMRLGRDLEDYVAHRFMEDTGKKVRRRNAMIYSTEYPFAHADVDRLVDGERAGLECKTTSTLDVRQFQGVEFPEKYYAQCVHYMAVTGCDRWYLCVLVFGRGVYTYTLERDQAEIDALMDAERDFWRYVTDNTPPPVDGAEATTDAITTIFADGGDNGTMELFGRKPLLDEREALKAQIKALDTRVNEIENTIKQDMGDVEKATADGGYKVSWKTQAGRRTFMVQALAHDHPEIDISQYYETGKPTRVFRITKRKQEE